ncbi:MAG: winged helix DNA-binding domain-containing protein, partial [Ignavibacteria bacterium]
MNFKQIANLRLINQHIVGTKLKAPKEIVSWMGAIQAQDYPMAKWAVGLRLHGSTDKEIESAFNAGKFLRTHVLRPTWHFVSADDIFWMIRLTAPHIKRSLRTRQKFLELDEITIRKSNKILEKLLSKREHLTRNQLFSGLEAEKIRTENQRGVHLLLDAELSCLICSGEVKNNERTYALFGERVTKTDSFTREEALAKLAEKYFSSHGPATLLDFVWWSGLPVSDARKSIEMIKHGFDSEKMGSQIYWFQNSAALQVKSKDPCYLLPAYDEYLISYKDRSSALEFQDHKKTVSSNGIFRPSI